MKASYLPEAVMQVLGLEHPLGQWHCSSNHVGAAEHPQAYTEVFRMTWEPQITGGAQKNGLHQ